MLVAAPGAGGGSDRFLAVFAYLAARFNYPEFLDGSAEDVLPALLATGDSGRTAWPLRAYLPDLAGPQVSARFEALRDRARGPARLAMLFAVVAAVSMMPRPDAVAEHSLGAGTGVGVVGCSDAWLPRRFRRSQSLPREFNRRVSRRAGFSLFFMLSGVRTSPSCGDATLARVDEQSPSERLE